MEWGDHYTGMALIIAGIAFGYWMKKRKFDRINAAGVERFSSYPRKLFARFNDGILGWLSVGLLLGGVMMLAVYYEASWGWIILVPVYAVVLFGLIGT